MGNAIKYLCVLSLSIGMSGVTYATMIYSDNDYTCGWENYASSTTIENALKIGVNLGVYAGGTTNIKFGQLNYGGGDWSTDMPTDMDFLQSSIQSRVGASVTTGSGRYGGGLAPGVSLADDDLTDFDFLVMVGHNSFSVGAANTAKLKSYIDGGGILFVDDCAGSPAVSAFETSFDALVFDMYGVNHASMNIIDPSHLLYKSFYTLDGSDFSYTSHGLGTEWAQLPLRGYENHPGQVTVPAPAAITLVLVGLAGATRLRRRTLRQA